MMGKSVPSKSIAQGIRALRRKEIIESRSAVLVGGMVFFVVPAIWTVILCLLEPREGVAPGAATIVLLIVGPLFAAVVGAQCVCRDLGSSLERFFLARPIKITQILRVKAWTGAGIVIVFVGAIGGLELFWWALQPLHRQERLEEVWGLFFLASVLSMFAFSVAFAAACVTRRSLTSMLMTGFVVSILLTIPLISKVPEWATVTQIARGWPADGQFAQCAGLIVVSGLICVLGVRFLFSPERRVDMGQRRFAWFVAITLLGFSFLALREAGATQPLTATYWHSRDYWKDSVGRFAVGLYCVAASADDGSIHLVDLNDAGRIIRNRRVSPAESAPFLPEVGGRTWIFDGHGNLAIVRNDNVFYYKDQDPAERTRLTLRRLDWESMEELPLIRLSWPSDHEYPDTCFISAAYATGSRVFLLARVSRGELYYYVAIAYEINDDEASAIASIRIFASKGEVLRFRRVFSQLDNGERRELLYVEDWRGRGYMCIDPLTTPNDLQQAIREFGPTPEFQWLPVADRWQVTVIQPPYGGEPLIGEWGILGVRIIGKISVSPWAALFRSQSPQFIAAGPGRWVELHPDHAIVYDLRDPSNPRRIGHICGPPFWGGDVTGDLLILHNELGFSVARLPSLVDAH